MTLYDLINPSDPVTFYAPSFTVAAAATIILGEGKLGASPVGEEGEEVPLLAFADQAYFDGWVQGLGYESFSEMLNENRSETVACLRTFATVSPDERKIYDLALRAITDDEKRTEFLEAWDDAKRSSLNQITNVAHRLADQLERKAA